MAEERNLVQSSAPEAATGETDATKQELQRRMEEAREQISQTVTEIKETVVNQYQQVRTSINDTLDWREHFRRRPVPFTAGAFGAGLVLGLAVGSAFTGDDDEDDDREADAAFGRIESGFDRLKSDTARKPYAASPSAYAASPILEQAASFGSSQDVGPEPRPTSGDRQRSVAQPVESSAPSSGASAGLGSFNASFDAGSGQEAETEEEHKGPSLLDRFKETKAYDRLQNELTTIGERVVEELSRTAQTVVVPALLSKLKDLIGIDLGTQRQVAQRSRLETQAAQQQQPNDASQQSGQSSDQSSGGAANFATSGGRNT